MSLAQMKWAPVSIHKVILTWLRSERGTNARSSSAFPMPLWSLGLSRLLDQPNLDDPEENRARLRLFYLTGRWLGFFVEIPPDTEWYEVHNLTDHELGELHVVNYADWNDPGDKNELAKVAARKQIALREPPSSWEPPILWGHNNAGPFTIIEGNNRLTAYAASGQSGLNRPVPMQCVWHVLDNCEFLMR
jgi:hypothetical protein